jgi:hypothetical protein
MERSISKLLIQLGGKCWFRGRSISKTPHSTDNYYNGVTNLGE